MGFCKLCGKLINAYKGYCFDCKKAGRTEGIIPTPIATGSFMKEMGISSW